MVRELLDKLRLQYITQGNGHEEIVSEVIRFLSGGGKWVQLRMKEATEEEMIPTAEAVQILCRNYQAVLIINDSTEVARIIDADGVHLGKTDMNPIAARILLGDDKIIGRTANTFEDIHQTAQLPIDYIGLGPYQFTTTKKNLSPVLGIGGYRDIFHRMKQENVEIPIVAIGGIVLEDIPVLNDAGIRFYAVSGSIGRSPDPENETRNFLQQIHKAEIEQKPKLCNL